MLFVWLFKFFMSLFVAPKTIPLIDFECQCPACGHRKKKRREFTRVMLDNEERAMVKLSCASCLFEWYTPVVSKAEWPAK